MENEVEFTVALLRTVAKDLQALSEDERQQLNEGTARLRLVFEAKSSSKKSEKSSATEIDTEAIQARLEKCRSREEAAALLSNGGFTKANLQKLTRAMDLPFQKDDNTQRLLDRIVESAVGFRLRSQAIQGSDNADEP